MPLRWAKQLMQGRYVKRAVQSQRLASAYAQEPLTGHYRAELLGKLHYMMKTAPAVLEEPLGLTGWGHKPWGQSCLVIGKRAATWQGWEKHADRPPDNAGDNGQIPK
jgi:hypothetical protein